MIDIYAHKEAVRQTIEKIREQKSRLTEEMTDEYSSINYPELMTALNRIETALHRSGAIEKFLKTTPDAIEQQRTMSIRHKVTQYETPLMIAERYNVELSDILKLNNMTTDELTGGTEIIIEVPAQESTNVAQNIPVYGDVSGNKILGQDFSNPITKDSRGDIAPFNPIDTIRKTLLYRVTTPTGAYPLHKDFGLNGIIGEEVEQDLANAMLQVKITEALEKDPRISEISNIGIDSDKNVTVNAITVNNSIVNM